MASQALLFSEPSIAETCVWCELSEGIYPEEWAGLCRYIGTLSPEQFEQLKGKIMPDPEDMGTALKNSLWRTDNLVTIPLVSMGPSGIGGEYQSETAD